MLHCSNPTRNRVFQGLFSQREAPKSFRIGTGFSLHAMPILSTPFLTEMLAHHPDLPAPADGPVLPAPRDGWIATGWRRVAAWMPILRLAARHRPLIRAHLLALSANDRYLRFGHAVSDSEVDAYVAHLDFDRDFIFGVFNWRLRPVAIAHLALGIQPLLTAEHAGVMAEFGVSVDARARGRGLGGLLFMVAAREARALGVQTLFIHALTENVPMLRIARRAGARVERHGGEAEAYLRLPLVGPPPAPRWYERLLPHFS